MNTWEGALKLLKILTVVFMLSGCSTQYSLLYKTNVMPNFKADKTDPLTFSLDPRPNGIHFTVQNNSDQTAKIIWDKSYFIMPDGNSFKALNADLLGEGYTTVIKAQYVSTIPSKSTFSRFTTAAYEVKYGNYWTISVTADVRPENNSNKENNEIKAMLLTQLAITWGKIIT